MIDSDEMPQNRFLAFSFARFATWHQSRPADQHEVTVEITAFEDLEAMHFVAEHPEQFRGEGRTTDEARARELRKHVLLNVHERVRLEVVDLAAALWLVFPTTAHPQ